MSKHSIIDYIIHLCIMNNSEYRRIHKDSVHIQLEAYDTSIDIICTLDEENRSLDVNAEFKTGFESTKTQQNYINMINGFRYDSRFWIEKTISSDITKYKKTYLINSDSSVRSTNIYAALESFILSSIDELSSFALVFFRTSQDINIFENNETRNSVFL